MLPVSSQSEAELTACFAQDIAGLVESFSEDATASKRSLDQMLSSDEGAFSRASIRVLARGIGSAGSRYVAHLLRKSNLLLPALEDPFASRSEEAGAAARVISQLGAPIETDLEGALAATLGEPSSAANAFRVVRLLQLLEAASTHPRFYLFQLELLSYPDSGVRSKSALLICRSSRSAALVGRMMLDEDPRVQANAVEALWTFDPAEAGPLLRIAARSKTPRVAANAVVGLYRIGDLSSIGLLFSMAQGADPNHRVSGAWAMGETGDPRFLPFLTAWFPNSSGNERVNVIQALSRIRRREKSLAETGTIEIRSWDAKISGSDRRLVLSLWAVDQPGLSGLQPTEFAIWEGEILLQNYEVSAQQNSGMDISGFVLPRFSSADDPYAMAVLDGIGRCLKYKRADDLWRLDRYLTEPRAGELLERASSPYDEFVLGAFAKTQQRGFLASGEVLRKIVENPGSKGRATDNIIGAFDRQSEAMIKFSGHRKLFLFLGQDCARGLDRHLERLKSFVASEQITLHGIAPKGAAGAEEFQELCLRTEGGSFAELAPGKIPDEVERIYAQSINRFEVTYRLPEQPVPAEGRIQITSGSGCGRASFIFKNA
jgi:HEAT repeats